MILQLTNSYPKVKTKTKVKKLLFSCVMFIKNLIALRAFYKCAEMVHFLYKNNNYSNGIELLKCPDLNNHQII